MSLEGTSGDNSEDDTALSEDDTAVEEESFTDLLRNYVFYSSTSEFQENLLDSYLRRLTVSTVKFALVVVGTLTLFLWPVDYVIFANPKILNAFEIWKPIVLFIIAYNLLGLQFLEFWKRNIYWLFLVGLSLAFLTVAFSFARLEDTGGPWFQVMFMIPMATILVPFKLLPRLLGTSIVVLSYILGYGIEFPSYLIHPDGLITITVTGGLILVSTLFGHVFYHLIRINFFKDRKLRRRELKMKHLARHDQLTGLTNRRHFENLFREEFERTIRYENNLSIMMLDIDHFKNVNDTYGHQVGDAVLEELGNIIERDIRASDFASRYGGEEFCIVLPETDKDGAFELGDRIRKRFSNTVFKSEKDKEFSVTCSIGIEEYNASIDDPEELIRKADDALYEAKETGRDRIVRA